MSFLKTLSAGKGSTKDVCDYLAFGPRGNEDHERALERYLAGGGTRALAFGHSPDLPDDQLAWSDAMEQTRRMWGKDRPPAWFERRQAAEPSLAWRSYYHFVISPAPEDHVGAREVGQIANEWCERAWPAEDGYQWIWSVHDDNGRRIMHAHVVLNAMNALTGTKVAISRERSDDLAWIVQEIGMKHGLATLPHLKQRRTEIADGDRSPHSQKRRVTIAETALTARGERSWMSEIRGEIDRAVACCGSWIEFVDRLESDGFKVEWSRRGIGYRHPDSTGSDLKALATSLGTDYTEEAIRARLGGDFRALLDPSASERRMEIRRGRVPIRSTELSSRILRNGVVGKIGGRLDVEGALERGFIMGRWEHARRVRGAASALDVIESEGIGSITELEQRVRDLASRSASIEEEVRELAAALEAAVSMRGGIVSAKAAEKELEMLPKGSWSTSVRKRRNELEQKAREGRTLYELGISRASGMLDEAGHLDEETIAKSIEDACRSRLDEIKERSRAAESDLKRLSAACESIEIVLGKKCTPRGWERTDSVFMPMTTRRTSRTASGSNIHAAIEEHRRSLEALCREIEAPKQRMRIEAGAISRGREFVVEKPSWAPRR